MQKDDVDGQTEEGVAAIKAKPLKKGIEQQVGVRDAQVCSKMNETREKELEGRMSWP